MKSPKYLIAIAAVATAIAPSLAFGQVVYNTGTQGCCDLLDPHYTLVAAPAGVPLGNLYSTVAVGSWVTPLPGSSWINPSGFDDWAAPEGNYTYRQTFALTSTAGARLTGTFTADNEVCVTLNGGPAQCSQGGVYGYEQYTAFEFTSGFQVGTNTLDYVVYNDGGPTALDVAISGPTIAKKLHSFGIHAGDGISPQADLIFDAAGNLYGTTYGGGAYGGGTVFELIPTGGGLWIERKLHNFGINSDDGIHPMAGLIFDAAGNLYGTTYGGGAYGGGTVFELMPRQGGGWTEKKLHNFGISSDDGIHPMARLILDAAGNLYGTTYAGGDYSGGTVFELTLNGGGDWTETKLHNFGISGTDGVHPMAALIFDAAGNLYGTTFEGGDYRGGAAFELMPTEGGGWIEKKLHNFGINRKDGTHPMGSLIFDAAGILYGTTSQGGSGPCSSGCGSVFELRPAAHGWIARKLHNFGIDSTDGTGPEGGLIFDAAGHLYGTTQAGGDYPCTGSGCGTVFELTRNTSGSWIETKLHNFGINGSDGADSRAGVISDVAGNLYGATRQGGNYSAGTVFEIQR